MFQNIASRASNPKYRLTCASRPAYCACRSEEEPSRQSGLWSGGGCDISNRNVQPLTPHHLSTALPPDERPARKPTGRFRLRERLLDSAGEQRRAPRVAAQSTSRSTIAESCRRLRHSSATSLYGRYGPSRCRRSPRRSGSRDSARPRSWPCCGCRAGTRPADRCSCCARRRGSAPSSCCRPPTGGSARSGGRRWPKFERV